jgi:hypothetical protein
MQDDPLATQMKQLIQDAELGAENECTPALQLVMEDRSNLEMFFLKRLYVPAQDVTEEDELFADLKLDPKYANRCAVAAYIPKPVSWTK